MSHFKLRTDLTDNFYGRTLFRVELTIDCKWGKKGELGGWVEKESNIRDNAWVSGNARVYGNAIVSGNAQVFGNAIVSGNARVYDDAWVFGNAQVFGNAIVSGNAIVLGNAWVSGDAVVSGNAQVLGNAWVSGNAQVFGNAQVSGDAIVSGNASKTPLQISGQKYHITISDNHVVWGCRKFTFDEVKALTLDQCNEKWDKNEFKLNKKIITEMIRYYRS